MSENTGYHSAQVLRIANQCPAVFGFQNVSATVMELYLEGYEMLFIKCVCACERQRDRQTGVYTVRLLDPMRW